MKDRTRNKRTAQHRGWVQSNTRISKLYCNGRLIQDIKIFTPPGKISAPPISNRKWCKLLKRLGVAVESWHTCILTDSTGTLQWSEKFEPGVPQRNPARQRQVRMANVKLMKTAYQIEAEKAA